MSGWRAKVDSALGRDTRDNRDTRSPDGADEGASVPFVPFVPAPLDALRSWCDALNALDPCEPRDGFTMGRWQKLYDCSVWLVETFGRQLAIDGWATGDLFGVHARKCELLAEYDGCGGLVDHLGDHRALVLADGVARWRYMGTLPQVYKRGWWPDLQPFWEIES